MDQQLEYLNLQAILNKLIKRFTFTDDQEDDSLLLNLKKESRYSYAELCCYSRYSPREERSSFDFTKIDTETLLETLYDLFPLLSPREKHILLARYNTQNPQTLASLAAHYNISRERVRQVEQNALRKLRKAFYERLSNK